MIPVERQSSIGKLLVYVTRLNLAYGTWLIKIEESKFRYILCSLIIIVNHIRKKYMIVIVSTIITSFKYRRST
jgi:hypothetical protein